MAAPIVYAQALAGERWEHYASWARLFPAKLLDRWGTRLPIKELWAGSLPCGWKEVDMLVVAGPFSRDITSSRATWQRTLDTYDQRRCVVSHNLDAPLARSSKQSSLLPAVMTALLLPEISRRRDWYADQLSVALVIKPTEISYWVAALEQVARHLTVVVERRQSVPSITVTGCCLRQLPISVERLDAQLIIVSRERLDWLRNIALPQEAVVFTTDGGPVMHDIGCSAASFTCLPPPLPEGLLADHADILPLVELIIRTAYLDDRLRSWPQRRHRQLALLQDAFRWSGWPYQWEVSLPAPYRAERSFIGD